MWVCVYLYVYIYIYNIQYPASPTNMFHMLVYKCINHLFLNKGVSSPKGKHHSFNGGNDFQTTNKHPKWPESWREAQHVETMIFHLWALCIWTQRQKVPNGKKWYIPNKYPLYKVYMGLTIKGTIPRVPPSSLWEKKTFCSSIWPYELT